MFLNKLKSQFVLGCAIAALGLTNSFGATWYVNDNSTAGDVFTTAAGNDASGNGSASAPYASAQHIINNVPAFASGDEIIIDAGTYNWPTILLENDNNIKITGAGAALTHISVAGGAGVFAHGTVSHQISDLHLTTFSGSTIFVRKNPSNVAGSISLVEDCKLEMLSGAAGLYVIDLVRDPMTFGFGFEVKNSELISNMAVLQAENYAPVAVRDCDISGKFADGGMFRYVGNPNNDNLLFDNKIDANNLWDDPNSVIIYTENGQDNQFHRNDIECGNATVGMEFAGTEAKMSIHSNFIYNVKTGIKYTTNAQFGGGNIIHNSINARFVGLDAGNISSTTFRSNIIKTHSNNAADACVIAGTIGAGSKFDNNLFYHPNAAVAAIIGGTSYANLAALQSAGLFTFSEEGAISWFNGSKGATADLRLHSGSIAIDKTLATGFTISTDIFNQPISGSVKDLGAFEFQQTGAKEITSVNDVEENALSLAVLGNTLEVANAGNDVVVEFYNMAGVLVKTVSGQSSINLDAFTSGLYVATVTSNGQAASERVFVQK